ncbi:MAG: hypothetical protein GTO53_07910, partial [Planctomycetales bacterium]|nr:hypothetical protein [Planctomycetales bacterium]
MIVEEGRIDYRLRCDYPGIRQDMDFVVLSQMKGRPALADLPKRQAVLEALLQL